jgi:hypothetical protein
MQQPAPPPSATVIPPDLPRTLLRPFAPAVAVALVACLFAFGLGAVMGIEEEALKAGLRTDAAAVRATIYVDDDQKIQAVLAKSWTYFKRAHLHGGALGTFALALTLVLALFPGRLLMRRIFAFGASLGALGYGLSWLLAGLLAPGLGSTTAAKESVAWLAMPSAGLIIVASAAAIVSVLSTLRTPAD